MNFEKFEQNNSEADVKKELPEVESFVKNAHEKKKGISPLSKYALIAIAGYLAGKNVERHIDVTGEMIDNLKSKDYVIESIDEGVSTPEYIHQVDESFSSDEFGSFKSSHHEDKAYIESLALVDEILEKENPELSPENLEKLELMRGALSESLKLLDDVLHDTEGK